MDKQILPDSSARSADKRASDFVIAKLEEQIAQGVIENDTPLPVERELMEQFGTSRTVIREAIAALSSRGLVESRPRHRPIAKKPDYETALTVMSGIVPHLLIQNSGVKNLYQIRVFIERGLVREAAVSATKEDIANLKAALSANENCIGDAEEFYKTDIAFHRILYGIPKNPIFPAIHQGFTTWLAPHWEKMPRLAERDVEIFQAHKAIYLAILERDPDAAEAALLEHLKTAWEFVRDTFEEDEA